MHLISDAVLSRPAAAAGSEDNERRNVSEINVFTGVGVASQLNQKQVSAE